MLLRYLPSCGSIQLTIWEVLSLEQFQDGPNGSHLKYQNRMILAILNFYNALMPPIKFWLNLTNGLGDVVLGISRWPPWWPSWILEWNDFSNSESLYCSDVSSFGSIRLTVWEELSFEEFQDGRLPLSLSTIQLMVLEKMSKMWKASDGWMTDNSPWHKLTRSKAPGELIKDITNSVTTLQQVWIPAWPHNFMVIDHEIISSVILLFCWFKKGSWQLWAKVCAQVLVNWLED